MESYIYAMLMQLFFVLLLRVEVHKTFTSVILDASREGTGQSFAVDSVNSQRYLLKRD